MTDERNQGGPTAMTWPEAAVRISLYVWRCAQ